jgi:hypothetical protein
VSEASLCTTLSPSFFLSSLFTLRIHGSRASNLTVSVFAHCAPSSCSILRHRAKLIQQSSYQVCSSFTSEMVLLFLRYSAALTFHLGCWPIPQRWSLVKLPPALSTDDGEGLFPAIPQNGNRSPPPTTSARCHPASRFLWHNAVRYCYSQSLFYRSQFFILFPDQFVRLRPSDLAIRFHLDCFPWLVPFTFPNQSSSLIAYLDYPKMDHLAVPRPAIYKARICIKFKNGRGLPASRSHAI